MYLPSTVDEVLEAVHDYREHPASIVAAEICVFIPGWVRRRTVCRASSCVSCRGSVQGEQPHPGGLHALHDDVQESLGELVAEHRVGLAGRPDTGAVERHGEYRSFGDRPEVPPVRREEPGPAEYAARAERVDDHVAATGHVQVEVDVAV